MKTMFLKENCNNKKKLIWADNIWKVSITSSWRTKLLFTWNFPIFNLSCVISHNSQVLLYLNGLNPWIEHLDIFLNMWNFILVNEPEKTLCILYNYKYGDFILVKSKQKSNILHHFIIIILSLYKYNYIMAQNHRLLYECVNCLEIFYSCVDCIIS